MGNLRVLKRWTGEKELEIFATFKETCVLLAQRPAAMFKDLNELSGKRSASSCRTHLPTTYCQ